MLCGVYLNLVLMFEVLVLVVKVWNVKIGELKKFICRLRYL